MGGGGGGFGRGTVGVLDAALGMEAGMVRGAAEDLKRTARGRKEVLATVEQAVATLEGGAAAADAKPEEQAARLKALLESLQGLKRKLEKVNSSEELYSNRTRARLDYLAELKPFKLSGAVAWNKRRLDRMLVDHVLRSGYIETAKVAAEDLDMLDLIDFDMFTNVQEIVRSLQARRLDVALKWCEKNRSKLRKQKSRFEFKVRKQGFLELVRGGKTAEALEFARVQLVPFLAGSDENVAEFQQATATLAFIGMESSPYQALFADSQWAGLVELFRKEVYKLHNFTSDSLLSMHLQAGLSALKNPTSFKKENANKDDPLSIKEFQELAADLPYTKHVHSKLVCHITGEIMDEDNPPMVLPNGYVYSLEGFKSIATKYPNGTRTVACPRTGELYDFKDLARAFIA